MDLDELKKNISTLDEVLAENNNTYINVNVNTRKTAQQKIVNKYRQSILICSVLAIVFLATWCGGINSEAFPRVYRLLLGIYLAIAAIWYTFIYSKAKEIDLISSAPMKIMRQVASLRFNFVIGEIVSGIALVVFFTLFLTNLWGIKQLAFWLIIATLAFGIILTLTYYIPKMLRDFKNLTAD
jgi:cytochrome bd-type quinol oxidase subunit 2